MAVKRFSFGILAAVQLTGTLITVAQTGRGGDQQAPAILANKEQATVRGDAGPSPAITNTARVLDFGSVPVGSSNELSFMVQNVGAGSLTIGASVSPPFSVLGGDPFVLRPAQTQVITVQFAPKSAGMQMTVVRLTGAGGSTVTVMGSAAGRVPAAPVRRRRAPTQPQPQGQGLRLIAGR